MKSVIIQIERSYSFFEVEVDAEDTTSGWFVIGQSSRYWYPLTLSEESEAREKLAALEPDEPDFERDEPVANGLEADDAANAAWGNRLAKMEARG